MISAYCIDDVTIIQSGGHDSWNEPLAPTEISVKGKIEYKTKLIRDLKGEGVVAGTAGAAMASAMVRFPGSIDVDLGRDLSHEDKLKFDGVEHVILKIDKPKAFSSPIYEVYVS